MPAPLVAIGDSLTQGFTSLAIQQTQHGYPALIADAMGLGRRKFRLPDFRGKGGLPLNIEYLARRLEATHGGDLSLFDWITAVFRMEDILDEVEAYWETGKGAQPVAAELYHNLASWGFEVGDAYTLSARMCEQAVAKQRPDLNPVPSEARLRTALRVLNPSRDPTRANDTQVSIARRIAEQEDGIEHMIVFLGANNALGTVVQLAIDETDDHPPGPCSGKTLWSRKAFEAEFDQLASEIDRIGPEHVYVGTIPYVTIPPITRGVMRDRGRLPRGSRYYDFYTRFWIRDKDFDPDRDPRLLGSDAQAIDARIDEFNSIICGHVDRRPHWHVVDICRMLDLLAVRRNHGSSDYPLPPALAGLDTRFFEISATGKVAHGGLIGLDGVHPTSCGYSLLAHEFLEVMKSEGGVKARPIDFAAARFWDTLVSSPPRTLDDMFGLLSTLERHFHFSRLLSSEP